MTSNRPVPRDLVAWTLDQLDQLDAADLRPTEERMRAADEFFALPPAERAVVLARGGDLDMLRGLLPELAIDEKHGRGRPPLDLHRRPYDRVTREALAARDARRIRALWRETFGRRPAGAPSPATIAARRWAEPLKDGLPDISADDVSRRVNG